MDWGSRGLHSSAFMNSLSLFFPRGEAFFIHSVRRLRHVVAPGSQLDADVEAFIKQESYHGREHELYNDALRPHFGAAQLWCFDAVIGGLLSLFEWGPRALALSGTVGLEHLTAVLGHTLLSDPTLLGGSEPHYGALWKYHSHEETEHKVSGADSYGN